MDDKEYEWAREVIREIARQRGVTEEKARSEMQDAIRQAFTSSMRRKNKAGLERWNAIESKGEIPTPEEMIVGISKMLISRREENGR